MHDKLWYDRYVKDWMHALPLGNGRIGALVFGDPDREIIGINEESLWSGTTAPEKYTTTPENLTKLRQLIAEERLKEASELFAQAFTSDPLRIRNYETFGRIYVDFSDKTPYTDYYKELDLQRGVASVSWKKEDASFQSESFVSEDRDVFVYRVSSDKPFSCKVRMDRAQDAYSAALSSDTLILNGRITYCDNPLHGKGAEGMSFGGKLKLLTDGESTPEHSALSVKDATFVLLYSTFATNYDVSTFTIDETKDYRKTLSDRLNGLTLADYDKMYEDHCRDHEKSFSAVRLHLDGEDRSNLPTDERLRQVREENAFDPGLYVLYYNYGRYLLTESSGRNATLPANLQGIWNWEFRPAWGSDYHTNVNVQMNYWPAEVGNCSETLAPLTHFVKMLRIFGSRTAKELFGARGWEVNVSTDIFGHVGVHGKVGRGCYPTAAAWMCLPLWEHYEYTNDRSYLEDVYPVLYDACLFLCDFLIEAEDGTLITSPSNSPENTFFYQEPDGTTEKCMLTQGATMDYQIIYALFTRMIHACALLHRDENFAEQLKAALDKLPPLRVSERYGTLCEWYKDYEEVEPEHRHISHLFGLYPSDQINESDPVIFEAAKNTIARRLQYGGGQTGWSRAWIVNFYARFKNGNEALSHLDELLKTGTEANLFDLCPPHIFQIDGNLGATAGINEMLIQSHLGTPGNRIVELLPALPDRWETGSVCGLKARGNMTFDFAWKKGKLTDVSVTAPQGSTLLLKLPAKTMPTGASDAYTVEDSLLRYVFNEQQTLRLQF